ncbi:MAG: flagellar protein FlaG [Acidobacteria bacterium]|nr:flagellar protein FlaG [Acidobacteriota bacterium]
METGSINPVALSMAASLTAPQPAERLAEQREIIQAVRAVNGAEVFGGNHELTFVMDRDTRRPVLKIVDRRTHEVITQIPPDYVLRLARQLESDRK